MACKFVSHYKSDYRDLQTWETDQGFKLRAAIKLKTNDTITIKKGAGVDHCTVSRVGTFLVLQVDPIGKRVILKKLGTGREGLALYEDPA